MAGCLGIHGVCRVRVTSPCGSPPAAQKASDTGDAFFSTGGRADQILEVMEHVLSGSVSEIFPTQTQTQIAAGEGNVAITC
jgi:hypothetical protein